MPIKSIRNVCCRWTAVVALWVCATILRPCEAGADQVFETLKIGTNTYRNVTVTTKSKSYVFLMHSGGMTSVNVLDLSPEVRRQLGYDETPVPAREANTVRAKESQPTAARAMENHVQDPTPETKVASAPFNIRHNPLSNLQLNIGIGVL